MIRVPFSLEMAVVPPASAMACRTVRCPLINQQTAGAIDGAYHVHHIRFMNHHRVTRQDIDIALRSVGQIFG